ncbi:tetratricopeptide repeat protein [Bacillus sp. FJAT-45350]|uniref:tetratricopeptide repeat protein n=1 Tax=Bacillus sp. FJAT-45350 TaxID=2011014 RepID=UPI000BB7C198|nr:tetratricopeptide repeat protein [Bacillus sp. FJAT-45350]
MSDEQNNQKENVILFPGLVSKYVDKGMGYLKEKSYHMALKSFEETLKLEPDHPQGRLGIVLSYIELGRLQEAVEASETMLREDIGDYYDVLQVHISLLVQLGQYQEVVTMLEAVIAEDRIPSHLAESFYHLLHFSRQMIEEPLLDDAVIGEASFNEQLVDEAFELLKVDDPLRQWKGIQTLKNSEHPQLVENISIFLQEEKNDILLKSMALQLLKDRNVDDPILVTKLNQTISVIPSNLSDLEHSSFGESVEQKLRMELESENPTLLENSLEIWWHYLFAIYPIESSTDDADVWAAAVHITALESHGFDFDEVEISNTYEVPLKEVLHNMNQLMDVQHQVFQGIER